MSRPDGWLPSSSQTGEARYCAFSRDETAVMDALKGLPAPIVERERSLAVRLVALARQKARNEIKNWQPLAG